MEEVRDVRIEKYCNLLEEVAVFVNRNASWYPIKRDFEMNSSKLRVFINPPYNWKHMGKGFIEDSKTPDFYLDGNGFTMAAIWSLRGLRFVKMMIEELKDKEDQAMKDIPERCYEQTLKNHHGMVTRTISSGILKLISLSDLPAWKTFGFEDIESGKAYIDDLYVRLNTVVYNITVFLKLYKIDELLFN